MRSQPHRSGGEYVVMLPFMAHGHLIPFLALANQIHRSTTFTVFIATTKLNVHYLRSAVSSASDVRFVELPFSGADHGLPSNAENTENLPLTKIVQLFHASSSLEPPCRSFLSRVVEERGRPPLCIISDVFLGWAVDVARSFGTVNVTFSTGGAYGTAAYVSLWLNLPHRKTDSDEFSLPGFPERCRFHLTQLHPFLRAANGTDTWSRFFQPQISLSLQSYAWLCNTVEEIELAGVEIFRNYLNLPVWCVGPLLPQAALSNSSSGQSISRHRVGKESDISTENCLDWLESQEPRSVLYICFGSQNTIGASQMMELAIGLERSEKPFVWVIRPPVGFDLRGEFLPEWLPEKFEERMREKNKGLLVRNWAPQLDILSHRSTGAFLSHCGWNSVMESLSQGVPIVAWPIAAEQAYNSKMLVEEMGVCMELTRGAQSANIAAERVREVIGRAMDGGGEGAEMRRRAEEVKLQIRAAMREEGEQKGSARKAMDDFVASLIANRDQVLK